MARAAAKAALGFRAHSGWATLVALRGPPDEPAILARRRVELAAPDVEGSKQPYHTAEGLPLEQARGIIERCTDGTRRLARAALRSALKELEASGHRAVGSGLLLASGRALPELPAILASHALIHTAEGELYREALVDASEACGLAVLKVKERELADVSAAALRLPPPRVQDRLSAWGRALGPPWRQDEKLSALVAWLVLQKKA